MERVATAIDGAALDGCGDWREWIREARAAITAMPDAQRIVVLEALLTEARGSVKLVAIFGVGEETRVKANDLFDRINAALTPPEEQPDDQG